MLEIALYYDKNTCKTVHHDIEYHSHPVIEQRLPKHHVVQVTVHTNFGEAAKMISQNTSQCLLIPYMASTATGSTAEMMLEKVKISTGARVMFMLYPVMLPWTEVIRKIFVHLHLT